MKGPTLSPARVRQILSAAQSTQALVIGDVMLDHFIWGSVGRISPEAPVPVVDFERESFIPGGAANVARNIASLNVPTELFGVVGADNSATQLRRLLEEQHIRGDGLVTVTSRSTSVKTRVVAHQQQVVRLDRESRGSIEAGITRRLLSSLSAEIRRSAAVIVCDYGKGTVTQSLLDQLRQLCRQHGAWLSLDPKPVHHLKLSGLSLITPNRKEAFELAGIVDETRNNDPLGDHNLMRVVDILLTQLRPGILLVTLGELGMLLCQAGKKTFHIPTQAREIFDVSGAGDTVIATFTLAISGGASPLEAAILSNHAAGIVVGKVGTAVVTPDELMASFEKK